MNYFISTLFQYKEHMKKNSNKFYQGDKKLKRGGFKCSYSNHEIKEILKCKNDFHYFCSTYIKVPHAETSQLIPFVIRDYQSRMEHALVNSNRVIVLAPRQSGKSMLVIAYMLWVATFNSLQSMILVADKAKTARKTLRKLKNMYKEMPFFLKLGIEEWNKGEIYFDNETIICAEATTSAGNRGDTTSLVYLDECAVIPSNLWDEFYTAIYPSLSANKKAKIIMTSTPVGYNHFYQFWNSAENGNSNYTPVRVKWDEVPGRDDAFRERAIADLGQGDKLKGLRKWNQEYECKFVGSGGTLIESHYLEKMKTRNAIESTMEGSFVVFEPPLEHHAYMAIIDVAEGVNGDSSTVQVFKMDIHKKKYLQVARYKNNQIKTNDFPTAIYQIGEYYNQALVLVESNTFGREITNRLAFDLEYENIYFSHENKDYGIKLNKSIKKIGCSYLKTFIEGENIEIVDVETVSEISQFVKKGETYKADDNAFDDLVVPLVHFSYFISKKELLENWFDVDEVKTVSKLSSQIEDELIPTLGFISNGSETIDFNEVVEKVTDETSGLKWGNIN